MPAYSGGNRWVGQAALGEPLKGSPLHVIAQHRPDAPQSGTPASIRRLSTGPDGPHYRLRDGWLIAVNDLRNAIRSIGKGYHLANLESRAEPCRSIVKQLLRQNSSPRRLQIPTWLEEDILEGFNVTFGPLAPSTGVRRLQLVPSVASEVSAACETVWKTPE